VAPERTMIFSAGQLHSSVQLLNLVAAANHSPASLKDCREVILVCPVANVVNICSRCGWLEVDLDGFLKPSKRGNVLRATVDFEERLRQQLRDIVAALQPAWSKKIMHGRKELVRFAPADVRQCFEEAGLLNAAPSDSVVHWWDEIANLARGVRSAVITEVGRRGERLTLAYERNRTGREPFWQSVESSFSGYDVLSVVSSTDMTPMQIEVKASELRPKDAFMHLTGNEWEASQQALSQVFHLWYLGNKPLLAIVNLEHVRPHVPQDQGEGSWESVKIPFGAFASCFKPVA
jgi:hypothetical protein